MPRWLAAAAGVGALAACASLPASEPTSKLPRAQWQQQITVHGKQGPLAPAAQAQVLNRVAADGPGELLAHHLSVLAGQGAVSGAGVDLYKGNAVRLLVDGPRTFAAMKAAIAAARHRVLVESYIVEDAGVAAEIGALLAQKAAEGLRVALLYDDVGSFGTDKAYFERLRAAGVRVCAFNPLAPGERPSAWRLGSINHRNHRKLTVVDDRVAFAGGINISQVYASGSFGSGGSGGGGGSKRPAPAPKDPLQEGWRDTHTELRGPVAVALAQAFEANWRGQRCEGALGAPAPGAGTEAGTRVAKVLASDPSADAGRNRVYSQLLESIRAARRSVALTMAYFAPGPEMVQALCDAARRGVLVRLVLPGRSDFALVLHAGRSYYGRLLAAGVQVHEMDEAVLHAKTALIDGVLASVGSSNMDWRSFVDNSELNVLVLGDDFAAELQTLFDQDLARSRRIDAQTWSERGLRQRLLEGVGRLAERWL